VKKAAKYKTRVIDSLAVYVMTSRNQFNMYPQFTLYNALFQNKCRYEVQIIKNLENILHLHHNRHLHNCTFRMASWVHSLLLSLVSGGTSSDGIEGQWNTIFPHIYGRCETYGPTGYVESKKIDNCSWIYVMFGRRRSWSILRLSRCV